MTAALLAMFFAVSQPAPPSSPSPAPEAGSTETPPIQYTVTIKQAAWRVRVTLRRGQPEPHQPLELLLDIARQPDLSRPFSFKANPGQARALTRLYARAVEAAALASKDEADRHLFDLPEVTSNRPAESE
jgi:hypothetical protein